jgi:predicted lipoprotein with Yx(FWY)xxD motif
MYAHAKISAAFGAMLLVAGCATTPAQFTDGVLTDAKGMTLYTFDKDTAGSGRSVCNGQCAVAWPPLKAVADAKPGGGYTVISRDDGSRQWAYDGKPLYLWVKDTKPGDRTGDGFRNVWHVVKQPAREMGAY